MVSTPHSGMDVFALSPTVSRSRVKVLALPVTILGGAFSREVDAREERRRRALLAQETAQQPLDDQGHQRHHTNQGLPGDGGHLHGSVSPMLSAATPDPLVAGTVGLILSRRITDAPQAQVPANDAFDHPRPPHAGHADDVLRILHGIVERQERQEEELRAIRQALHGMQRPLPPGRGAAWGAQALPGTAENERASGAAHTGVTLLPPPRRGAAAARTPVDIGANASPEAHVGPAPPALGLNRPSIASSAGGASSAATGGPSTRI